MKATVIIPTYNQADTIARAIESVLRQQCPQPFEILIADDGSTDNTRAICEEYAYRYPDKIRLTPQHPNRGIVGNYFQAFKDARGTYISDCAGDDEWLDSSRLRRSIELLEANHNLSVVFTDVECIEITTGGKQQVSLASGLSRYNRWMRPLVKGSELLLGVLDHTNALPYILSSALYRKSVITAALKESPQAVCCPESGIEDVPVIAALASGGDAAYIPIVGYRYYLNNSSLSNSDDPARLYSIYAPAFILTLKLARHYGINPRLLRRHFNEKTLYLASLCRRAKSKKLARDLRGRIAMWPMRLSLRAGIHLFLTRGCRDYD